MLCYLCKDILSSEKHANKKTLIHIQKNFRKNVIGVDERNRITFEII